MLLKRKRKRDLTTGFLSLRREGLSRSSFWKARRSPDWAQPWMVVGLTDLDRWVCISTQSSNILKTSFLASFLCIFFIFVESDQFGVQLFFRAISLLALTQTKSPPTLAPNPTYDAIFLPLFSPSNFCPAYIPSIHFFRFPLLYYYFPFLYIVKITCPIQQSL